MLKGKHNILSHGKSSSGMITVKNNGGNKLRTYRTFKTFFAWEFYFSRITVRCHLIAMARFRTSLAIETGRHRKPPIPPEQRLCIYCNSGKVDDELHFLIECYHLQYYREKLYETAVYYNAQLINMSHTERCAICLRPVTLLLSES